MNLRIERAHLNRLGLLFICINIALFVCVHYAPGLLGGYHADEIGSSRIAHVFVMVNYPVFWVFDALHSQSNWSATPLEVALLILCLLFYWYCQGLFLDKIVRMLRGIGDGSPKVPVQR
jgi:hypothetical protein